MRHVLLSALMVSVVIALAGCGSHVEGSAARGSEAASAGNCVLLANGNKLCGADAKAYCEGFIRDGTDEQTAAACRAAGAGVLSEGGVRERNRAEADAELRQLQYDQVLPGAMGAESGHYLGTDESNGHVTVNLLYDGMPPLHLPGVICAALREIEGAPATATVWTSAASIPCGS